MKSFLEMKQYLFAIQLPSQENCNLQEARREGQEMNFPRSIADKDSKSYDKIPNNKAITITI